MKHQTIVTYTHPDGASIKFHADQMLITACDGTATVYVDIGQLGKLDLGRALIRIGQQEGE